MTSGNAPSKQALSETTTHAIEAVRSELVKVALDIHAHPELNYQEEHAARLLSGTLRSTGSRWNGAWAALRLHLPPPFLVGLAMDQLSPF